MLFLWLVFLLGSISTSLVPMRAFPLAWRGLAIAVVLAVASSTSARADDPTVSELQVRLVQSRQHLNDLYARSAAASERLNGAKYELRQAEAELARHQAEQATAKKHLAVQQEAVAELTVAQLQSGSSVSSWVKMFQSNGPRELLEQASAYETTNEAMAARIDALTARKVVYDAAARDSAVAAKARRLAAGEQKAAQAAIDESIAQAEAAEADALAERQTLLRQLAAAQDTTVQAVASKQDQIDQRLDESGPGVPPTTDPRPDPTDPRPTDPKPTTPTPTTTPPPVDPPPASGSKVEKAIAYAEDQLGEPYKWGGAGPKSWDCSGLTMRAWQAAGVNLPHYAGSQYAQTKKVAVSKIRRGDLLYWSNGGPGSIYHVAMYLGGGKMIQAPRPGRDVEIVPLSYWIQPDLASRPG